MVGEFRSVESFFNMPDSKPNADGLKVPAPSPEVARGIKRFYPVSLRHTTQGWQLHVFWGRLVVSLILLVVFGWIGTASAAFLFVKYERGFEDVRFNDMLMLPARWQKYQVARGDFYIKTAQEQLKQEQYREAFYSLRIGVVKSPGNKDGRLLLAQFYNAWKRPEQAKQILLDGLPYLKGDREYLKLFFSYLLQQQEDQRTLSICHELLSGDKDLSARNQLIALASSSAGFFRGNYDQAEDVMKAYGLDTTRDGRLLSVRIDWDRGLKDLAIQHLGQLVLEFPNDEEIYAQQMSYLREMGRDADARRESFLRVIGHPDNAHARIDLLYALKKDGDTTGVKTNIDAIFIDFPHDKQALMALGDFAADNGDVALARRVYERIKVHGFDAQGAGLMIVEANIVAKNYEGALEAVRLLVKENPEWSKHYAPIFNGLQAIAHYGSGDAESAQLFLNNFLRQPNIRADNLVAVSKRLLAIGAKAQAHQVLEQACEDDPLNQAALSNLVQLDLDLNNTDTLAKNITRLMVMRKPSHDLLVLAYKKLGSDLFLFSPGRGSVLRDLRDATSSNLPHFSGKS